MNIRIVIVTVGLLTVLPFVSMAEQQILTPRQQARLTPEVKAVSTVAPAVVNITSTLAERRSVQDLSPFELFLGIPGRDYHSESVGSGIIIDGSRSLVLTNAHVVNGATVISVRLLDGRIFDADVVGAEPDFDIAVLKLRGAKQLPSAVMGDSTDLMPGESVIAIGNPFGFSHTVTTGVVSALNRTIEAEDGVFTDLIQTDAAINPGNSGGPLLNILGELIGVNTAIYSKAQGIGFAIPISKARRVVDEILDQGHVSIPWLALIGQNVDMRTARYLHLPSSQGLLITEVFAEGPAAKAGLKPGDVIRFMSGNDVTDRDKYLLLLRNHQPHMPIDVTIWRDGGDKRFTLVPTDFDDDSARKLALRRWGMSVKDGRRGAEVTEVRSNSPAEQLGLKAGDYIAGVSGRTIASRADFLNAFRRDFLKQQVLLQVLRSGRLYQVLMGL
jgi:S1-C subfamily serine protease